MPELLIVGIESAASLLFLISVIMGWRMFSMTKKTTDMWLLISFAALIACLASALNALEWFYSQSAELDKLGEYASIAFSVVWIYIAYKFILFKKFAKS